MASGLKYNANSGGGTPSSSLTDLEDVFVSRDYFTNGNLWTWGNNGNGQLGLGTTLVGTTNNFGIGKPIALTNATNWKQVVANSSSSAAIKTDGTLWTWGFGYYGHLGSGSTVDRNSPVQVGTLTNWSSISNSEASLYGAVKTDGTLWMWGRNDYGQCGVGSTLGRSSPTQVGTLSNWKLVSCGSYMSAAIKTDGTLWTWGWNQYNNLGTNNTINRSSPVQVGTLTDWSKISCNWMGVLAIKTNGSLWAIGNAAALTYFLSSPVQIGTLTDWSLVLSGSYSNFGIRSNGTLWAWGGNSRYELGLGDSIARSSPTQVGSLTNWKDFAAPSGCGYSMAVRKTDGSIWGWGYNYGQFGDGVSMQNPSQSQYYIKSPVQLPLPYKIWNSLSINGEHGIATVLDDGL